MELKKLFPRVVLIGLAVSVLSTSAFAQTRPRVTLPGDDGNEATCLPDDLSATPVALPESKPVWEAKPKPTIDVAPTVGAPTSSSLKIEPLLLAAIDQRLGSRYRWGATGPTRFDCSGFVWSIFQATGINGQAIYVNPSKRVVIAQFSARAQAVDPDQMQESAEVFDAIADKLASR